MADYSGSTNIASASKSLSILFLCLARNCEDTIPLFFSYLDRLQAVGFSCLAIIGENGSSDRTRTLIENNVGTHVELLDTARMTDEPNRLVRMSMGRQALLERAKIGGFVADYVCVTDLDDVMLMPPEPVAFRKAIEHLKTNSELFAIGATSYPVYYDLLALRADGHDYSQLSAEIAAAKKKPLSYFGFHKRRIYENQSRMTQSGSVICTSSFNGFCLYNSHDYFLGKYRSENEAKICEHVNFNLSVAYATGKKMLISTELIIQAPAEHIPVGYIRFWVDRIRKLL